MKKALLTLLLLLSCMGCARGQVRFETRSTDAVREMALRADKLVFIDLYAPWCPLCRAMDEQVFSRSDVADFLHARFIPVKYDIDRPTGKALMRRYGVSGIPAYLIFNTDGELLGRITGASTAAEFISAVSRIAARSEPEE